MIVAANADGRVIDVEPLNYVRRNTAGIWDPCDPKDAEAIAHHNQLYSIDTPIPLPPLTDDEGNIIEDDRVAPTATIYEAPDGSLTVEALGLAKDHVVQIEDLEIGTIDLGDAVTDLESSALDLADALDTSTTETETALVDIADMIESMNERLKALEGE